MIMDSLFAKFHMIIEVHTIMYIMY